MTLMLWTGVIVHQLNFLLIGPRERIIERLGPWKEAGRRGEVGTMLLSVQDPAVLELMAGEML